MLSQRRQPSGERKHKNINHKEDITIVKTGKQDCQWWPDKKPKVDHTGAERGMLTYLHPVFYTNTLSHGREWYWLAGCKCGRETIIRASSRSVSCGCQLGRKKGTGEKVVATDNMLGQIYPGLNSAHPKGEFNSTVNCIHNGYKCDKWHEGMSEKPKCFGARCYVNERLAIGIF